MDESYCPTTAVPDELVVDTAHLGAVRQVLRHLEIQDTVTDSIPEFDLTLLSLKHVEEDKPEEEWEKVSDLDPVLTEVRVRLAGRCGGWTPVIGKNRRMSNTFGAYPQTRSQSIWNPMPADHHGAWLVGDAGSGVRVGLVDTKILRHPALPDSAIRASEDDRFTKEEGEPCDFEEGHGVFAAGLILKKAPGAVVVAHAALGPDGKAEAWHVVKKLAKFLADEPGHRVHLIVLASGCRTRDGLPPMILERAIERLSPHITVVAAAGNHGAVDGMSPSTLITRNSPTWPAALPGVVAVGVPKPSRQGTPDYSPDLPWVTCTVKPETADTFMSTYLDSKAVTLHNGTTTDTLDSGYASWRGTSFAAAYLGGAIAAKMPDTHMDAREALAQLYQGDVVTEFAWHAERREQA